MGYYGRGDSNCYGRGDYYRGDYYRGDPGLLGFLKKAGGTALRVAGRVAGATPIGQAVTGVLRAVRTGVQSPTEEVMRIPSSAPPFGVDSMMAPPQGQIVLGTSAPSGHVLQAGGVCTTKGHHLNKSGYYRRTPAGSVIWIEPRSVCVKNRSLNPANGRAARRSLSRLYAFKRMAVKTVKLLEPRSKKRFAGFKRKGR